MALSFVLPKKKSVFEKSNVTTIGKGLQGGIPKVVAPAPVTMAANVAKAQASTPQYGGDSTVAATWAQNLATRTSGLSALKLADDQDSANNVTFQDQLAKQNANTQSSGAANAARMGLGTSGYLAQQTLDTQRATDAQATAATSALKDRTDARGLQRQDLIKQYGDPNDPTSHGLAGDQAFAEGKDRFLASYTPPAVAAAPAAAVSTATPGYPHVNAATGAAYKIQTIGGKTVHVYSDGRKVVVSK